MKTLDFPIFATGSTQRVSITLILEDIQSPFQTIQVFESLEFGRCLAIDGAVQAASSDHTLYDETITKCVQAEDRSILILGGGDGFVASAALAKAPSAEITLIEIDPAVVAIAQRHFKQTIFSHSQVRLLYADALQWLTSAARENSCTYHNIIFDLTDNPTRTPLSESSFRDFYQRSFTAACSLLAPSASIAVQAGAARVTSNWLDTAAILTDLLSSLFTSVERNDVLIPSFGEHIAFLTARS